MINKFIISKYFSYVIIIFFVVILSITFIHLDVNIITDFFYDSVSGLNTNNFFSLILIFLLFILRSTSIIIPVLPGTIFSAAAGFQFGFTQGLVIIFFADFFVVFFVVFLATFFVVFLATFFVVFFFSTKLFDENQNIILLNISLCIIKVPRG